VAGYTAVGAKEWKGKAMSHIGDGNKMVSDTPRTDAEANEQYSMVLTGNGLRRALVQSDFARQLERELREVQSENIRLRAALANSNGAWKRLRSGE
jgi:hypothetical protein